MVIDKASHKAYLYKKVNLDGNGRAKQYPLDKLPLAISVSQKLVDGAESKENYTTFKGGEQLFKAEEWVFMKDVLKDVKTASVEEGVVLNELKELFDKE